jgi:hypothetical protein
MQFPRTNLAQFPSCFAFWSLTLPRRIGGLVVPSPLNDVALTSCLTTLFVFLVGCLSVSELKVTDDVTAAAEQECGAGRAVSECNGEVRSYGRSCKERQISPAVADVVINKQRRHLMAAAPKITKPGAETKDHSMAADPNDKCLDARCAAVSLTLLFL